MGKKREKFPGKLQVFTPEEDHGKTLLITPIEDESKVYYAAINRELGFCMALIELPPRNYIIKIKGGDIERLVSITEGGHSFIDLRN